MLLYSLPHRDIWSSTLWTFSGSTAQLWILTFKIWFDFLQVETALKWWPRGGWSFRQYAIWSTASILFLDFDSTVYRNTFFAGCSVTVHVSAIACTPVRRWGMGDDVRTLAIKEQQNHAHPSTDVYKITSSLIEGQHFLQIDYSGQQAMYNPQF